MSITQLQKEVMQFASVNDFVSSDALETFRKRLESENNLDTLSHAFDKFHQAACPKCQVKGWFKFHFLGRMSHQECHYSWYVSPGTYAVEQIKGVFRYGMEFGAGMSADAERRGEGGGCLTVVFGFFFGALFRLPFVVILIPIQAAISLAQSPVTPFANLLPASNSTISKNPTKETGTPHFQPAPAPLSSPASEPGAIEPSELLWYAFSDSEVDVQTNCPPQQPVSASQIYLDRAEEALNKGDFGVCILQLDICLSSDPPPDVSIVAWGSLFYAISNVYGFLKKAPADFSDEDYLWHLRAMRCLDNAIGVFEQHFENTKSATRFEGLYERNKERQSLAAGAGLALPDESGEMNVRDLENLKTLSLPSLFCLDVEDTNTGNQLYIKEQYEKESDAFKIKFLQRVAELKPEHSHELELERLKIEFRIPVKLMDDGRPEEAISIYKRAIARTDSSLLRLVAAREIVIARARMWSETENMSWITSGAPENTEIIKYCQIAIKEHSRVHPELQQMFSVEAQASILASIHQSENSPASKAQVESTVLPENSASSNVMTFSRSNMIGSESSILSGEKARWFIGAWIGLTGLLLLLIAFPRKKMEIEEKLSSQSIETSVGRLPSPEPSIAPSPLSNPSTSEVAVAEASPTTATPVLNMAEAKSGYIPGLNARVTALKFFEGGRDVPSYGRRVYKTSFSNVETRYVYYELNLEYERPEKRIQFAIDATFYFPDGSVAGKSRLQAYAMSEWTQSTHALGWGYQELGRWRPGTYRVVLSVSSVTIAEGHFEIVGSASRDSERPTLHRSQGLNIPGLNARVTAVKFFEGGRDMPYYGYRYYQTSFPNLETRYVYYELNLEYERPERRIEFEIDATFYFPDGSVMGKNRLLASARVEWTQSSYASRCGYGEGGHWRPGTYRVVLSVSNVTIAEGHFEIF